MYHYISCVLFCATLCFAVDFNSAFEATNETHSRLKKSSSLKSNDIYDSITLRTIKHFVLTLNLNTKLKMIVNKLPILLF